MGRSVFALLLIWFAGARSACKGDLNEPLAGLQHSRPRILFTAADQAEVEKLAESNHLLARLIKQNRVNAEQMLTGDRVRYAIPDGKRLLQQSRKCLQRVVQDRRILSNAASPWWGDEPCRLLMR